MLQLRSVLLGLSILMASTLCAQEKAPTIESLWETGSLWQVGENKQKVADARQAIIERGDVGLEYAISKLAVGGTLEIRCLRAVIGGFGEKSVAHLTENILNESISARRNVADLLVRAEAAHNITEHVKRYGHMPTAIDFAKELESALEAETDPFARSELIES